MIVQCNTMKYDESPDILVIFKLQVFTRVSLNSPTCRKTLVGVRVPVPISEQAEK